MRLVIIGAGFAGMYAALSAARLRDIQGVSPEELEIALVSPEPTLVIRPRLYEPKPETLTAPLLDVLKAIDVRYVQGSAETIDTKSRTVRSSAAEGERRRSPTTGWSWPPAAGCSARTFPALPSTASASTLLDDAIALDQHLHELAKRPASNGARHGRRCRRRLHRHRGGDRDARAAARHPRQGRQDARHHRRAQRGDRPRHGRQVRAPSSRRRLRKLGVETRLGVGVTSLDKSGVTLSNGEHIEAATVIWAAGMRAAPLTAQIPAERDNFGRLLVDRDLRVPSVPGVFATGDAARAACDDVGNYALMSCQHATRMGAFAGNNAAAELLGVPTKPYHQKAYVTCLDLGEAGALFTRGWERKVEMVGDEAKETKQEINTVWIYPPSAERAAALASADPERVTDL